MKLTATIRQVTVHLLIYLRNEEQVELRINASFTRIGKSDDVIVCTPALILLLPKIIRGKFALIRG
jgi:hypothetical protein